MHALTVNTLITYH